MGTTPTERRKQIRHKVRIEGRIIISDSSIPITVTEVSVDGIRLLAQQPVSSGRSMVLSLQLDEEILLFATVLWVLESRTEERLQYQMGAETGAIVLPDIKAIAFPEKAELVEAILSRIPGWDAVSSAE
jgi:hypothetical protein